MLVKSPGVCTELTYGANKAGALNPLAIKDPAKKLSFQPSKIFTSLPKINLS